MNMEVTLGGSRKRCLVGVAERGLLKKVNASHPGGLGLVLRFWPEVVEAVSF